MSGLYLTIMRRLLRWRWCEAEAQSRIAALEEMIRAIRGDRR